MNEDIEGAHHLAAVPFQGKIIVFGGNAFNTAYFSYTLSEGSHKVEQDLSGDDSIPGKMCKGSVLMMQGKFMAAGFRERREC